MARAVELYKQYVKDLVPALGADNFQTLVFLQPLPKYFHDISDRKGGNILGLNLQEHNAIVWSGGVAVKNDQKGLAIAQTRLNAMVAELSNFAAELDGGNRLVYMNYADPSQDPLGSYGKESVDFLKRVANEYDPTGAFQRRFPGGFKISRVHV